MRALPSLSRRLAFGLLVAVPFAGPLVGASVGDRLQAALAGIPRGGRSAVALFDCRANAWVYTWNAGEPMKTASTAKLFTAAAALAELGPEYRFRTRLVQLGSRQQDAIAGLGIIGGGDPCLDEHFAEGGDPDRFFAGWAATLKAAGIRRIAGDVVVDTRLFDGPIRPATYPSDAANLQRWYSAPASAFAWADNCIEVRVLPTAIGQSAEVQVRPQSPRIQVANATRTVASAKGDLVVARAADGNALTVSGTYSQPTAWFALSIHSDPDLLAADHLVGHLRRAGIAVDGQVRLGAVDEAAPVLVEEVHELLPALTILNQRSQNFYGEQILRIIGARKLGEGSVASGTRAVLASLRRIVGEDAATIELLDGSGLSYGNEAPAGVMVRLLAVMERSRFGADWIATLKEYDPVAGRQSHVKTGTLNVAVCLAGYIDGPTGGRHAFTILLDRGSSSSIDWAHQLRKKLYRIIAEAVP